MKLKFSFKKDVDLAFCGWVAFLIGLCLVVISLHDKYQCGGGEDDTCLAPRSASPDIANVWFSSEMNLNGHAAIYTNEEYCPDSSCTLTASQSFHCSDASNDGWLYNHFGKPKASARCISLGCSSFQCATVKYQCDGEGNVLSGTIPRLSCTDPMLNVHVQIIPFSIGLLCLLLSASVLFYSSFLHFRRQKVEEAEKLKRDNQSEGQEDSEDRDGNSLAEQDDYELFNSAEASNNKKVTEGRNVPMLVVTAPSENSIGA